MVIGVPALCSLDATGIWCAQSMSWLVFSTCSAMADELGGHEVRALLCSLRRCSRSSSLSPEEVETLLSFCLNVTYLAYRGDFFQQTFAKQWVAPVSVTVANLVMEDVEQRALSTYHSPPPFWKRYLDDTCTALAADEVHIFHDHLNSIEPSMQFTFETETEGKLSFLDSLITHHPDDDLSTTVFWKATHTDKYLDFQSHHPLVHKAAVVRTLFSRANNICSSLMEKGVEEKHITHALKNNGYPSQFITRQSQPTRRPPIPDTVDMPKATVVLPYVRHVSELIQRILTPLEIHTCFKPHRTLRQLLVHPKDPIPLLQKPGVVYQVPCASCPEMYTGQTGHTLEHRLKEHRRTLTSGPPNSSAIAEHALNTNHDIDWASVSVIDSHPHLHLRCALEAWHIRSQQHPMNREQGLLSQSYNSLIYSSSLLCTSMSN